ncbi:hypothetical protein OIU77_018800 [Salix suchowensis]|uniref:Uncharacterized protein n=1 Tax=Salix suchowensis TaxID=1278906 RepID=A0ABQ9CHR3_9ROSI|nr:hypothetical protein OIU77_018800 [Salix suchowensis]
MEGYMEAVIASYQGRCRVLRISLAKSMTNNYHPDYNFCCSNFGIWYKGHAENGNEFEIAAELSSHENVLKLIGYCPETSIPALVYESTGNRALFDEIHFHPAPLSFRRRSTDIHRKIQRPCNSCLSKESYYIFCAQVIQFTDVTARDISLRVREAVNGVDCYLL